MPIYEYQCKNCGWQFEQLQKMGDEPLHICPKCKQPDLQKLVSETSFRLKGKGWYVTDFKNQDKKPKKSEPKETKEKSCACKGCKHSCPKKTADK